MIRLLALVSAASLSCSAATVVPSSSPTPFETSSATMIVVPLPHPTPRIFVPTADAKPLSGGCGSTTVVQGGIPQALADATGNNAPGTPYAIAHPGTAAAFLFGYPMHIPGSGIDYSNKVLWVVGTARTGDLLIDGHPIGAGEPHVQYVQSPNSFPGEIYPSSIDVPARGCWQFTLRWSDQVAEIELEYR